VSYRVTASRGLRLAIGWPVVAAGGGRSWSCLLQPWRDRAHARALESERERAESERECQREGRVPVLNLSTATRRAGERHGHWRPRGNEALQAVGHEHYCSSNFKISIPPRKYKLKSHFPPIISPKPIDDLFHRLHRCVELQEYSNFY